MGQRIKILLVANLHREAGTVFLLWFLTTNVSANVDAADYQSFWLWSGVKPQAVLARAQSLYILQGQISVSRRHPKGNPQLIAQGISIPRLQSADIWLVYRAHTLDWTPNIYRAVLFQMRRWRLSGNPVVGLQIDFDARTRYLHKYANFIQDLRTRLPRRYRLSITGLMDWSSHADMKTLNCLKASVDEIVIQTYQGRRSIPNYADYLHRLSRLNLPFKIGLIQHGEWRESDFLRDNPWFRGYVVFLRNR